MCGGGNRFGKIEPADSQKIWLYGRIGNKAAKNLFLLCFRRCNRRIIFAKLFCESSRGLIDELGTSVGRLIEEMMQQ